jgi:hypothetical protein
MPFERTTSIPLIINRLRIGNGLRQFLNFAIVSGVAFVLLDHLTTQEQIDRVRPAGFIIHETGPGSRQAFTLARASAVTAIDFHHQSLRFLQLRIVSLHFLTLPQLPYLDQRGRLGNKGLNASKRLTRR